MRYEVPKTPPELDPPKLNASSADEIVVILKYPGNTELLKLRDEMDQLDRRLYLNPDGTYEAVRTVRP
jgi:hypothetical protein